MVLGAIMIGEGAAEVLISKTAAGYLLKSPICSCSDKGGQPCDKPYTNVHGAVQAFNFPRREQVHKAVSLKRGEAKGFADRLCHAGGFAASSHCNRRIFAAPPFANMDSIPANGAVPIPNAHGPDIKRFNGPNKA